MKIGSAGVQSVVAALALAGVFAAPLRGQVAPATTTATTGTQQAGAGQPASDLVPVIVMFTGESDWDYVGSTGGSFGSGGQGYGGAVSIPSVASTTPNSVATPARAQALPTSGGQALLTSGGQALRPTRRVTNTAMAAALPVRMPTPHPAPKTAQPAGAMAGPPKDCNRR